MGKVFEKLDTKTGAQMFLIVTIMKSIGTLLKMPGVLK